MCSQRSDISRQIEFYYDISLPFLSRKLARLVYWKYVQYNAYQLQSNIKSGIWNFCKLNTYFLHGTYIYIFVVIRFDTLFFSFVGENGRNLFFCDVAHSWSIRESRETEAISRVADNYWNVSMRFVATILSYFSQMSALTVNVSVIPGYLLALLLHQS